MHWPPFNAFVATLLCRNIYLFFCLAQLSFRFSSDARWRFSIGNRAHNLVFFYFLHLLFKIYLYTFTRSAMGTTPTILQLPTQRFLLFFFLSSNQFFPLLRLNTSRRLGYANQKLLRRRRQRASQSVLLLPPSPELHPRSSVDVSGPLLTRYH